MSSNFSSIELERQEFVALIKYFKSVAGALTGLFAALPISGYFIEPLLTNELVVIGPPLAIVASIALSLHLFFRRKDDQVSKIEKAANKFFIGAAVCIVVFVLAWLNVVKNVDDRWHITGWTLTDEAQQAIRNKYVTNDTPKDLLDRMGHQSEDRIWKARWLAKAVLVFSFSGFCACMVGSFFLYTLRHFVRDRTPRSKRKSDSA